MMKMGQDDLFPKGGKPFKGYLESQVKTLANVVNDIRVKTEDELLEKQRQLIDKYLINFFEIDFDNVQREVNPSKRDLSTLPEIQTHGEKGTYEVWEFRYTLMISGRNSDWMRTYYPDKQGSSRDYFRNCDIYLNPKELIIVFSYYGFNLDADLLASQSKKEFDSLLNYIKEDYELMQKEAETYNKNLADIIKPYSDQKAQEIAKRQKIENLLGINNDYFYPVQVFFRKSEAFIATISKDDNKVYRPSIAEKDYKNILEEIHIIGGALEKYPKLARGKQESELRFHLIIHLELVIKGVAITGESYHKEGKTDILIQYETNVLFIAECKFWNGKETYFDTINQLIERYVNYKDDRVAIVFFNPNKDSAEALEVIKRETSNHPLYAGVIEQRDINWFNFIFHLKDNANAKVKVAVLIYHISEQNVTNKKKNK